MEYSFNVQEKCYRRAKKKIEHLKNECFEFLENIQK